MPLDGGSPHMLRFFSNPRFLAVYSGVLTIAFVFTVALGLARGSFSLHQVSASENPAAQHLDLDQLTVHRINIVEPDGTPRLIISNKAEFPGSPFKGKEIARPDRSDSAGMLFMNDEGTENGGLIFAGYQSPDGKFHSSGHLSFDEYEQDQTLSLDSDQDGDDRETAYQINDNSTTLLTPDVFAAIDKVRSMPDGPEKKKARADLLARYPMRLHARASLERLSDKSSALRLRDPQGQTRILLRVAADGTPAMQFFDASGKVTHQWPDTANQSPLPEKK
jgi:hypothetical protein